MKCIPVRTPDLRPGDAIFDGFIQDDTFHASLFNVLVIAINHVNGNVRVTCMDHERIYSQFWNLSYELWVLR